MTRIRLLVTFLLIAPMGPAARAALVVDFSPDTTGRAVGSDQQNGLTSFSGGAFGQFVGDRFTLASDTIITGGSIFSPNTASVGTGVLFMIFPDVAGVSGTALYQINSTLDLVDSTLTSTQSNLTSKHATISPITLLAGTYWFSMPGTGGKDIGASATTFAGRYDDGNYRSGTITPPATMPNLVFQGGDLFFTLEGSPANAAVPEPASLTIWGLGALVCSLGAYRRRSRA